MSRETGLVPFSVRLTLELTGLARLFARGPVERKVGRLEHICSEQKSSTSFWAGFLLSVSFIGAKASLKVRNLRFEFG